MKLLNDRSSSVRVDAEDAVGAVAAPVHRARVRQAAQGLRRHRALHRMELVDVAGAVDRAVTPNSELAERSRRAELDRDRVRVTPSSGLPRSQASSSMSPKMWQLAHDASPLREERAAS